MSVNISQRLVQQTKSIRKFQSASAGKYIHGKQRQRLVFCQSSPQEKAKEVLQTVNQGLDKVVEKLPLPKSQAKVGITVVGGFIVFGVVKQLVNTVLFLGAIAGIGYLLINKGDDGEKSSSSSSNTSTTSSTASSKMDDPMAEVDRIMDKYK